MRLSPQQILFIENIKKKFWLPPVLLGLFFVLEGVEQFLNYTKLSELLFSILLVNLLIFILYKTVNKFTVKAGIITTILIIPFFFYIDIVEFFKDLQIESLQRFRFLFVLLTLIVVAAIRIVIKTNNSLHRLNLYLITLSSALIIIKTLIIGFALINYTDKKKPLIINNSNIKIDPSIKTLPDIYYIILDSYTSSNSLKEFWNYNNTEFTESLKTRGFFVTDSFHSNYSNTLFSIASSLNMSYLNKNPIYKKYKFYELLSLSEIIKKNRVTSILSDFGYSINNLSLFDIQTQKSFYDFPVLLKYSLPEYLLFNRSILKVLKEGLLLRLSNININFFWKFSVFKHIPKTNLCIYKKLISCNKSAHPQFTYAHFMMPHYPFFFKKDSSFHDNIGDIVPEENSAIYKKNYLEQLIFTNKLIISLVDSILTKSAKPPIIIIQGDHGFREIKEAKRKEESYSIFNAFYLPEKKIIADSVKSPVNTFRLIFNSYYRSKLEILPSKRVIGSL